MARNILIIQGHPDPAGGHLCHALADAYAEGACEAGSEVRRVEVAQLDFPILRTQADWMRGEEAAPETLRPAIADSRWGDHLLMIYPLWLGTMPALLKAFMEQAFRPGVALSEEKGEFPKPLFKGKSARVAITMGMPALAYRWVFGAHSLKSLERNVLRLAGVKPVRESIFGMVDSLSEAKTARLLEGFRKTGRKDAT